MGRKNNKKESDSNFNGAINFSHCDLTLLNLKYPSESQTDGRSEQDSSDKFEKENRKKKQRRNKSHNQEENHSTGDSFVHIHLKDAQSKNYYVGAPYNFVPIENKTLHYDERKIPGHNAADHALLSGQVTYTVIAHGPVSIGGHEDCSFFTDEKGNYAIPGSTIRGLVRSNAQILSFSSFDNDIDDYQLMYRDMASTSPLGKHYEDVLEGTNNNDEDQPTMPKNVRACYIRNEGGKYFLYGTVMDTSVGKQNYMVVRENHMFNNKNFRYLYDNYHMQYKKEEKTTTYKAGKAKESKNGDKPDKDTKFKPFFTRISYACDKEKQVTCIMAPDENIRKTGYLLSTGFVPKKQAVYVIPQIDEQHLLMEIPDKDIRSYQTDYNNKLTIMQSAGTDGFYALPKEGETRPAFYINYDGMLYFGYTPHLRLFYKHSIKEGWKQEETPMDYARAIFGYTDKVSSRKGRVFFENAPVAGPKSNHIGKQAYILSTPKPSSYLDYIKQEEYTPAKTYEDDDFQLRGVKQYWIQETIQPGNNGDNKKVASEITTLPAGTKFQGIVHFHNLKEEELGLLLLSVALKDNAIQNIGRAKAYGQGAINIQIDQLSVFDPKKAYQSANPADFLHPYHTEDPSRYIAVYEKTLDEWTRKMFHKTANEVDQLKVFVQMKHIKMDNQDVRYMTIGEKGTGKSKEYQQRKQDGGYALPSAKELIEKQGNPINH